MSRLKKQAMSQNQKYVPYIRRAVINAPPKVDPPTEGYLRHSGLDTSKIRPMGLNECLFSPSPKVIEALQANLHMITRYPDAQCPTLSDIVSARTGIDTDRIVWGNGSEELLKGAVDLSLSPGEGLVLPVPTFWGYKALVATFEPDVTEVLNLPDGHTDIDGIIAAINNTTKIVFLITPNNPTGRMVDQEGLEKIVSGVPEDVLLCIDEAYYDFGLHAGGPNVLDVLKTRKGPWITVFTFSKAYAMAGMRIGYAICSDNMLAESLRKTTCVFNVPVLAQYAAEAAFNDIDYLNLMLDWVAEGREQIFADLRELGLDPFPSVTNFISTTLPINGRTCLRAMLEKGVQINAWADKGFENYIRITVGKAEDNAACLIALKEVLDENA